MVEPIMPPPPKCEHCGDPLPFAAFFRGVPLYLDCPKPHTVTMVRSKSGVYLIRELDAKLETS